MKIIKLFLIVFFPLFMHAQTSKTTNFTEQELALIHQDNEQIPMRVLLTTSDSDLDFLKQKALPVPKINGDLKLLAHRMLTTVNDPNTKGVGIAAPQVGISKRAFWVKRFDKEGAPFEFFVNPRITWYSDIKRYGQEGCLSIPDQTGKVYRSLVIQIEYCDLEGKSHSEIIEGYTAVICQHEYDHLNGILFLDNIIETDKMNFIKSELKNELYYQVLNNNKI